MASESTNNTNSSNSDSYPFLSKFGGVQTLSIVDFMKIWRHYDSDKSGFIETEDKEDGSNEFRDFISDFLKVCVGQCDSETVKETMEYCIETYDVNNDGKFQLGEMIKLLPVEDNFMSQFHSSPSSSSAAAGGGGGGAGGVKRGPIAKEDFERIFKHYDQDNSGKVEGEEIDGLIRDLVSVDDEEAGRELTMAKLASIREELLQVADLDGDGQLDKSELEYFLSVGKKF